MAMALQSLQTKNMFKLSLQTGLQYLNHLVHLPKDNPTRLHAIKDQATSYVLGFPGKTG